MTNTVPTAPFRGAGRPEATAVLERLIDIAAQRLKIDRVKLRQHNVIPHEKLPYRTATGLPYDSGDFAGNLTRMIEGADWKGFPARRREAKKRGQLRGIGIANYVETPVGMPHERVEVNVSAKGKVELAVGTQSTGQGHETSFAPGDGRSARRPTGGHQFHQRRHREDRLRRRHAFRSLDAARRHADVRDVAHRDRQGAPDRGRHARRGRRRYFVHRRTVHGAEQQPASDDLRHGQAIDDLPSLPDDLRGPLRTEETFTGRIPAYPTGCAVCEVEIDPDTGAIEIRRYASIDDAGQAINPLILHGQVHGGIAQGIGQALMEAAVYDGNGQVLTGSFMDYGIPRADQFPHMDVALTEDPTKGNPLRVKGGGEAGITPRWRCS